MTTRTGRSLVQQINGLSVPSGALALWGLGQSGFVIKGGETIVYVDPYLSGQVGEGGRTASGRFPRQFPPPLSPGEATNAQWVFCTHDHNDHTDPETLGPLARVSPGARFVGATSSREVFRSLGISDECILVPPGDAPQTLGPLTYTAIPAAHYGLDRDAEGGFLYLGFIMQLNGVTLYHAGDTILYDGLVERLRQHAIDIACLPVNGRDGWRERRGMIGNLDGREAAELAVAVNADVLIPMHNDVFAANHVAPAILADFLDRAYPRQRCHWLQPGELYYYV
jgi:L-ascorbate metabolism protein UlaG (beta-lactamase superfamily)